MKSKINPLLLKKLNTSKHRISMCTAFEVGETTVRYWLKHNPSLLTEYDKLRYLEQVAREINFKEEILIIKP